MLPRADFCGSLLKSREEDSESGSGPDVEIKRSYAFT